MPSPATIHLDYWDCWRFGRIGSSSRSSGLVLVQGFLESLDVVYCRPLTRESYPYFMKLSCERRSFKRFKVHHQMTCTEESITYLCRFMEQQQLPKGPHVYEYPAWPTSIRLWQLSCKTYRLIRPPIVTISLLVMVNWEWKQGNFLRTWVGLELTYFRSWSINANRCATPQL